MDPKRLEALKNMAPPTRGDELQQFLCADNWMRMSIPEYNRLVSPLSSVLEEGSSARWSTPKKEAFAIVESVSRLDYMLLHPEGSELFTDHKNLVFIFNPFSFNPATPKHVANKIERWALTLTKYRYKIFYISVEKNCWADLLSRWGGPAPPTSDKLSSLLVAPIAPDLDPHFQWPSADENFEEQAAAFEKGEKLDNSASKQGLVCNQAGAIWIPNCADYLKLHICTLDTVWSYEHRGISTTEANIRENFIWLKMGSDIPAFCNTCIPCLSTSGGRRIPRPFGHALHADSPNELLHFDFLFMGKSNTKDVYCLILKDDASSFVMLEPWMNADADSAAQTLIRWFSLFGVVLQWNSHHGRHFKNQLLSLLNRALHAHHHFTTPYCPQSNGTVETVCKKVLSACRALLSEFRMKETECPSILPLIQSVLNHSVGPSLGNRAPVTAFTGLPADNPLRSLIPPSTSHVESMEFVKAQRVMKISSLVEALEEVQRETRTRRKNTRDDAVQLHNAKTHVRAVNFDIGDLVLVANRARTK